MSEAGGPARRRHARRNNALLSRRTPTPPVQQSQPQALTAVLVFQPPPPLLSSQGPFALPRIYFPTHPPSPQFCRVPCAPNPPPLFRQPAHRSHLPICGSGSPRSPSVARHRCNDPPYHSTSTPRLRSGTLSCQQGRRMHALFHGDRPPRAALFIAAGLLRPPPSPLFFCPRRNDSEPCLPLASQAGQPLPPPIPSAADATLQVGVRARRCRAMRPGVGRCRREAAMPPLHPLPPCRLQPTPLAGFPH